MASRPPSGTLAVRGVVVVLVVLAIGAFIAWKGLDSTPPGGSSASGQPSATTLAPTTVPTETTAPPATTALPPSGATKVIVANAAGVKGAAGKMSDKLRGAGFTVVEPTNASPVQATTVVYYVPDAKAQGDSVAAYLQLPAAQVQPMPIPPPISDLKGAQVLVLLGKDLAS